MLLLRLSLLFGSVLLATALDLKAAVITNAAVIDLSNVTITDDGSGGKLILGFNSTAVPITPFTPVVGDTLVISVSFANSARLKIINGPNTVDSVGPDYFESLTFYYEGSGGHSTSTTSVVFNGLNGNLTNPNPGSSSIGILAQSIANEFTDSFISFTGLTMTTTISSLPNSGSQTYSQFGLFGGRAGGYEILSDAPAVPEPTSMACWATGALLLIWGRKHRKRKASSLSDQALSLNP